MINQIALTPVFGLQLVAYGGFATYALVIFTALVGYFHYKGKSLIPFSWHSKLAFLTILSGSVHGLMGLSIMMGF